MNGNFVEHKTDKFDSEIINDTIKKVIFQPMDHEDDVPIQLFSDEKIRELFKEATETSIITSSSSTTATTTSSSSDLMDSSSSLKFASQPLPVPPNTQSSCYDDCLPSTQEDLTSWQLIDSNNSALNSNTSTKKSLSSQKDKTISTQSSDQNDDEFYTNNKEFDETHRQEMQRRQELKLAAQKGTDDLKKKKKKVW